MDQQTIPVGNSGADSRRVLDALTPINGEAAPVVNAVFIGQIFVNTDAPAIYISVATDSASPADDWMLLAPDRQM